MATHRPLSADGARHADIVATRDPAVAAHVVAAADLPLPAFQSWRAEAADARPLFAIVCGVTAPNALVAWHAQRPASVQAIVVAAPVAVLRALWNDATVAPLVADARVTWCCAETAAQAAEWWRDYLARDARIALVDRTQIVWGTATEAVRVHATMFLHEYARTREQLESSLGNGDVTDEWAGLRNVLGNLPHFAACPVVDPLRGIGRGLPGVVVATGPSLPGTLDALPCLPEHAVVAACDSAMPLLLQRGMTPHLITCLERVPATYRLIAPLPALPETLLVATPVVQAATVGVYRGPRAFVGTESAPLHWVREYRPTHVGISAATMAYVLLAQLGCDPIYLVGQDLAFDRATLASHAVGAHSLLLTDGATRVRDAQADPANTVPGNDGMPILTSTTYRDMAGSYRNVLWQQGVRCINVIPMACGMALAGTTHCEPAAAAPLLAAQRLDAGWRARMLAQLATDVLPARATLQATVRVSIQGCDEWLGHCRTQLRAVAPDPAWIRAAEQTLQGCLMSPLAHGVMRAIFGKMTIPLLRESYALAWNGRAPQDQVPAMAAHLERWLRTVIDWIERTRILLLEAA